MRRRSAARGGPGRADFDCRSPSTFPCCLSVCVRQSHIEVTVQVSPRQRADCQFAGGRTGHPCWRDRRTQRVPGLTRPAAMQAVFHRRSGSERTSHSAGLRRMTLTSLKHPLVALSTGPASISDLRLCVAVVLGTERFLGELPAHLSICPATAGHLLPLGLAQSLYTAES